MNKVGAVYGQGLYALAKDEGLTQILLQQLQALEEAFAGQEAFLKLLATHDLPKQERIRIIDSSFRDQVHPYVLNFLKLLTEKGHIRQFSACCKAFTGEYNRENGILEVRAVSALALTPEQKQRLSEKLAALTGKKITLCCKVDPSVLGGIRLQYDGQQVDGTVRGRLEAMGKTLKNTVI